MTSEDEPIRPQNTVMQCAACNHNVWIASDTDPKDVFCLSCVDLVDRLLDNAGAAE